MLDGSPSWKTLANLCAGMPTNGHLVVGSRSVPPLPIRSLQSQGDVVMIDEMQMAFDRAEISAFAEVRGLNREAGVELPAWPALAELTSSIGTEASVGFVWRQFSTPSPTNDAMRWPNSFAWPCIDDQLVAAIVGERWTAAAAGRWVAVIESIGSDRRFHDLWNEALVDEADPAEWRKALVTGAALLANRGEGMRAARCLHLAGAETQLIESARAFAKSSISNGLSAADAAWYCQALPLSARNGPLGHYLRLIHSPDFGSDTSRDEMTEIAQLAAKGGDRELASLALWRLVQMYGDSTITDLAMSDETLAIMALDEPYAEASRGLIESHYAEQAHDVERALAAVSMFERLDTDVRRAATGSRYVALGYPERVQTSLIDVLNNGVNEPVDAHAVWLRGEIDAASAWAIASELPVRYGRRRFAGVQVPLLSVVASVALAAGAISDARELADSALLMANGTQPKLRLFAEMANVLVVLAEDGIDAATECLIAIDQTVPLAPWPAWAHMGSICIVRALLPRAEWLDDQAFGPSIGMAVRAGKILADLYQGGEGVGAAELPWANPNLMRAQIPIVMICELACAAGLDDPAVARCFDELPNGQRILRTLQKHRSPIVAAAASARLADEPMRPPYDLVIRTFGELSVHRSDGVAVSDRVRGGRVHELLSYLLVEAAPRRGDLAMAMWPDLSEKKAAGNLRITLASLLDLIEPDRLPGTSWFVRSGDGRLRLTDEGVDVDLAMIDRELDAAREAERNGLPTVALDHFRTALSLYDGDFLPSSEQEKVIHDRLRYQSLAYNAACRVTELLLAKGSQRTPAAFCRSGDDDRSDCRAGVPARDPMPSRPWFSIGGPSGRATAGGAPHAKNSPDYRQPPRRSVGQRQGEKAGLSLARFCWSSVCWLATTLASECRRQRGSLRRSCMDW
ncbi:MAG: BTAD domain-containing putative transcriptional regulator [Acidimicrobiales bacterium]